MNNDKIHQYNFFEKSFGQFNLVKNPEKILETEPDFVSFVKIKEHGFSNKKINSEKVSSRYWYTREGVYRESDHWGYVRNCQWFLNEPKRKRKKGKVLAFCSWSTFKEIKVLSHDIFNNPIWDDILKNNEVFIITNNYKWKVNYHIYSTTFEDKKGTCGFCDIEYSGFLKTLIINK